jgi:hypothetical protein
MKYNPGNDEWSLHQSDDGRFGWWLVGETSADRIRILPGTTSRRRAFADCVTVNRAAPEQTFDHPGGKLGIWLSDTNYTDNVAGESNRNPRWRLTRRTGCTP